MRSTGLDVVELGCGTAYVSAWLARRGARPVGVDVTPAQLATARRCQAEFGIEFPLVEASAEDVPLAVASFDLAVSEYGASIWCDPHLWIPEAHRLLRPGGRLWFLRNSTLSLLCAPDEGKPSEALAAPAARARAARVAGRARRRVAAAARRAVPPAAADGLRRRRPRRAVSARRCGRPRVLRHVLGGVGEEVAGRGDLGREEARHELASSLASTSPQRRAILEQLRIPFNVVAPVYVEHDPPDADPVELVRAHAEGKAAIGSRARGRHARRRHDRPPRRPDLRQAGRPRRRARDARRARRAHPPRGLRALPARRRLRRASSTRPPRHVPRAAERAEIERVPRRGEWEGRAGGYAIQGLGARLVARIDGDYLNVVGLPAALLLDTLAAHAPNLLQIAAARLLRP